MSFNAVILMVGLLLLDPARQPAPVKAPNGSPMQSSSESRRADRSQRLDLRPTPTPPALGTENAATALADELAREIDAMRTRPINDADAALVRDAALTYRMLARELLMRGDGSEVQPHAIVVAGFRIADARASFDAALSSAQIGMTDRVRAALERFRDTGLGSLRAAPAASLLETTRSIVAGLQPVLEAASVPPLTDHWPTLRSRLTATARDAAVEPIARSWSDRLRAAANEENTPPDVATALHAIAEKLAAAEEWPDLEPEVATIARSLLPVPAEARQFSETAWVPRTLRDQWLERVIVAIGKCNDASQRAAAMREIEHFGAVTRGVAAGTQLVRPRDQTSSRGPIDPARVARTLDALSAATADASAHRHALDRLAMVTSLLDTMVEVRRLETAEVRRDWRTLRRQLARDALKAEDPVLRQVESLAAPDASPADPASSSLLESQRRRIRALRALDAVDKALTEIEARSVTTGSPLATRLRGFLTQLSDPARAESALIVLDRFSQQWQQLRQPATETAIRAGETETLDRCAGRSIELLGELDRRRAAWASAWAAGQPDDAWNHAAELVELLAIIEDSAALVRSSAQPRLIGRWGGWDDLGGVPGSTHAIDGRLAVALEAVARNDEQALFDALALLSTETPLWRLRARLLRCLSPALESLPDGLAGSLGRATGEPGPGAFMQERADALAELGRFSRELLYAHTVRDTDMTELIESIEAYLREMAVDLLHSLDREAESARQHALNAAPAPPLPPDRPGQSPRD